MITNSSFPPTSSPDTRSTAKSGEGAETSTSASASASAFLLPSFQYLPSIQLQDSAVETFLKSYILPSRLHQSHDSLTTDQQNILKREPSLQKQFPGARPINEILVLICGHGGRDERCGKLGPLLRNEFEEKLQRQNIALLHDAPVANAVEAKSEVDGYVPTARVGLISHIGGHKFAGNVIIYIPPLFTSNSLAGKGIWYGRVGAEHVEGIVATTILDGKVIKDMFRGGIDQSGEILRL
jgi:hypothetical protein